MKNVKFAIIAFAALTLGLTSCTRDDKNPQDDEKQSIIVKLPSNTVLATRLVEAPVSTGTTETSLTNAVVFLLNNTSVVMVEDADETDILAQYVKINDVPASVNGVLVVANVPSGDIDDLKDETTVAGIEKYPFTITSQSTAGITGKVLMGKTSTFTDDFNPDSGDGDTDAYKTADVALDAITARFEIGDVEPGTGVTSVKLEGVWINNFYADNSVTSTTLYESDDASWVIDPTANTAGSETAITLADITIYDPEEYYEEHDASVDGSAKVYAFQLFAGEYVPHVIMLVSGEYDNGKFFLGWLTFKNFTTGGDAKITEVENNKIYKVGLAGIPVNAGDITIVPELKPFDLGVKCTITEWTEENVTPGV